MQKHFFKTKSILTFPCIYIFKCTTLTRKYLSEFIKQSQIHSHHTRNDNLRLPSYQTSTFRRSALYNCITIYNALPEELKSQAIYESLKKKLKYTYKKALFTLLPNLPIKLCDTGLQKNK